MDKSTKRVMWYFIIMVVGLPALMIVSPMISEYHKNRSKQSNLDVSVSDSEYVEQLYESSENPEPVKPASQPSSQQPRRRTYDRPSDASAFFMAQEFVKKRLKAPSTADFPLYLPSHDKDVSVKVKSDGTFIVVGYVDAENSFGAKIRTYYACELAYLGKDEWRLIDMTSWH